MTAAATPGTTSGLVASASGSTQVNLSWTAATEPGGSITQYLIERCQGASCSTFAQVGTSPTTTYADSGLSAATSYSYRVRAKDAAGNIGAYTNIATAVTAAAVPGAPSGLVATAVSSTQVNLSWTVATEPGGSIVQYLIERCQGAGCSTFTQIGTATGSTYADAGLTGSTNYSYRARAKDAAGNTGPYSNVASAVTSAPAIGAPTGLTATRVANTQIKLNWSAAVESGGTIKQYLIERCNGTRCSNFVQIGTAVGTSYVDSSLPRYSYPTSYSYRIRVSDAAGNTGPYSVVVSITWP